MARFLLLAVGFYSCSDFTLAHFVETIPGDIFPADLVLELLFLNVNGLGFSLNRG